MTLQHQRYSASLNHILHPLKAKVNEVGPPNVYVQAEELGGEFTRITRGLPFRSVCNFSPSLIRHEGHQLIAWRSQPEPFCFRQDMKYFYYNSTPTDVYVGELVNDSTIVGAKKIRKKKHILSYEDPRLFVHSGGSLMCQFVTSTYASRYDTTKHVMAKSPKVCVGEIDKFGDCIEAFYPKIGDNFKDGGTEKNWCFFPDGDTTRLLYTTVPITIKTPGEKQKIIDSSVLRRITGPHPTFNSTAPVKVGDEWLVFYHYKFMGKAMHLPRGVLFYVLSAYTLDEDLTKIVRILPQPMFSGSLDDQVINWTDTQGNVVSNQPACILPFGVTVDDDEKTLAMSLGVNDNFMGIFRMGINDLFSLMERV